MIYLASPYSHPDPKVKQQRFEQVCKVAAQLMRQDRVVFCPIAHTHPMDKYVPQGENTHGFWLRQDFEFLQLCSDLYIVTLDGWKESKGVQAEMALAKMLHLPISFIDTDGDYLCPKD